MLCKVSFLSSKKIKNACGLASHEFMVHGLTCLFGFYFLFETRSLILFSHSQKKMIEKQNSVELQDKIDYCHLEY